MDIFLSLILLSAVVAMLLLIWFNTDAFIEYTKLFGLASLFKVNQYLVETKDDPALSYTKWLGENYDNFFVKLIRCPKCFVVWIAGFINVPIYIVISLMTTPLVWITLPLAVLATAYFGLLLYLILIKLVI